MVAAMPEATAKKKRVGLRYTGARLVKVTISEFLNPSSAAKKLPSIRLPNSAGFENRKCEFTPKKFEMMRVLVGDGASTPERFC